MYVQQIYTACLAQASYYIEANNEAVIIDPIRDNNLYIDLLQKRNAKLKYIFETHFHADFVSGHVELAKLTQAKIIFGPNADTVYESIKAKDRQEFNVGNLKIRVLHTPGHTLESSCYLLLSESEKEEAVFTGDTLFIGEVGRPDLAVNPTITKEHLAGLLYESLHNVLMQLPDNVIVYPGHGAGSACGKNISADRSSTIGNQRQFNYALQKMSKNDFVSIVLDGLSVAPRYFAHDVLMNKEGYNPIKDVLKRSLNKLTLSTILEYIEEGYVILDVRMPNDFEKGFIPQSINIGKTGMFAPWVANLIAPNKPIVLICYPAEEAEVISRLARVGFENVVGYTHGIEEWQSGGKDLDYVHSVDPSTIFNDDIKYLDVRKNNELDLGFVPGSTHIPLSDLGNNLSKINKDEDYVVYCAGGYRSMIACSILKSKGYHKVKNIYGGFNLIAQHIK